MAVARAAQIAKNRHTGCADGYIRQPKPPGAPEGIADDDRHAFPRSLAKGCRDLFCGPIRIAWEQGDDVETGNIRMVHAGIGANETVARFDDQHMIAADDAARLS